MAPLPPRPVVRGLLGVRNTLKRAADALTPPQLFVVEGALAAMEAKLTAVSAELGVPDALADGRKSVGQLAARLGADADALERMMRFLASRGVYKRRRDGRYRNTLRSTLLRDGTPDSLRDWVRFIGSDWHWLIWNESEHAIRTGGSAAVAATGSDFFHYIQHQNPEAGRTFDAAMESMSRLVAPLIATRVDLGRTDSICDVGGGTGTNLAVLLTRAPHATGVVYDLPEVVAKADAVLGHLPQHRWSAQGGDFFESVPAGHDLYLLQAIVHDWGDDEATAILRNVRRAMAPDGRVLVVDAVLDPDERYDIAKAIDVLMLVVTGSGRERTLGQFRELFADAELAVDDRIVLPTGTSVFVLKPA